uniref:Calcium voltage-gated channel subunit alpha1 H n=1 Tax=Nothoprocta perdicaria TaxID=30464 RepID=A0A8C6ZS94_NOTPE
MTPRGGGKPDFGEGPFAWGGGRIFFCSVGSPPPPRRGGSRGSGRADKGPGGAGVRAEQVPYPALAPTAFFCLKQTTRPRSWCLRLVSRQHAGHPAELRHPGHVPALRGLTKPHKLVVHGEN